MKKKEITWENGETDIFNYDLLMKLNLKGRKIKIEDLKGNEE